MLRWWAHFSRNNMAFSSPSSTVAVPAQMAPSVEWPSPDTTVAAPEALIASALVTKYEPDITRRQRFW